MTSHTQGAQTTLDGLAVAVKKALPVTKASLKKVCLELIINADLVSLFFYFWANIDISPF